MNKQQIKDLALSNGFKLKQQPNGKMDLNPYVYDFAEALLAKANESVKELEAINLELAANVEACCELVEMDMGAAIERLFEIDNTESKALLNKFAIKQKIEALDDLLEEIKCSVVVPKRYEQLQEPYLEGIKHCIQFIECQSEQLRKEQE
ncbi:MAG: hypothetical protein Unbinned8596contig1000_26 [Prokaryotic dsDNA virus sp.]|nr:MAG: hypothetical protein Unbinned8596contig1000_26 [Prokaryotic dsDNA virus sp.]|tara:strand:- start:7933 stop:8382 length:450 start_codon:yes stop_codon:yes gene_type:complete